MPISRVRRLADRRLGQAARRYRCGQRAARSSAASRARAEVRAAQLAHEAARRFATRGGREI